MVIFHQKVFCKVPCQLQTFVELLLLSVSDWMTCRINVVDMLRGGVAMPFGSRPIYMSMLVNRRVGSRSSLSLSFYENCYFIFPVINICDWKKFILLLNVVTHC